MQPQNNPMHQPQSIQATLASLRQHLWALLTPMDNMAAEGLFTLGKVRERLGTMGEVDLQVHQANALPEVLQQLSHTNAVSPLVLPEHCQNIVHKIVALAPVLPWYQRPVANNSGFMAGHCNAQIIGPQGLEVRQDLMVGVTLMQPNIVYPEHQHEPEELYLVLGKGRWRQGKGDWHTPSLGGLVYNPSNVMHSMKSLDQPFMALWCLPLDKPFKSFSQPSLMPESPQ